MFFMKENLDVQCYRDTFLCIIQIDLTVVRLQDNYTKKNTTVSHCLVFLLDSSLTRELGLEKIFILFIYSLV